MVMDTANALRRAARRSARRACTWRWCSTSTAISRASSRPATCSRRSPARSRRTRRASRRSSTRDGWLVPRIGLDAGRRVRRDDRRPRSTRTPITRPCRASCWPSSTICPRSARSSRSGPLALRGRRPRRPPHRQGAGLARHRDGPLISATASPLTASTSRSIPVVDGVNIGARLGRGRSWTSQRTPRGAGAADGGGGDRRRARARGDGALRAGGGRDRRRRDGAAAGAGRRPCGSKPGYAEVRQLRRAAGAGAQRPRSASSGPGGWSRCLAREGDAVAAGAPAGAARRRVRWRTRAPGWTPRARRRRPWSSSLA